MDIVLFRNDPVQETTEEIAVIRLPDVQTEYADSVVPVTPKKVVPLNDLPIMKTPGKKIREYGLQGQGKSPRRKRFVYEHKFTMFTWTNSEKKDMYF